jgi:hypothetical protein
MTKYGLSLRRKVLPWVFLCGLAVLPLACGSSPGDAPAQAEKTWLARVGNQAVDAREFQAYLEQQTGRNPRLPLTSAMKRNLLEKFIEKQLLLAEAERQGLGGQPEVIKELKGMEQQILIKHLFSRQEKELAGQVKIDNEEIQKYYSDMGQVVRFRYASIADPDRANVDLDNWTRQAPRSEVVDSGEVRLADLNENWKGQILRLPVKKPQIVKIDSQWFVVEVVQKREEAVLPLDQVREEIVRELTDRKGKVILQNWVNSLKGPNRLEINEDYSWR